MGKYLIALFVVLILLLGGIEVLLLFSYAAECKDGVLIKGGVGVSYTCVR